MAIDPAHNPVERRDGSAPTEPPPPDGTVLLLLAASCLPVLSAVSITPILPDMQEHFAAVPQAEALVSLTLAVPSLTVALLSPIVGYALDRTRRRSLITGALVVFSVAGVAPMWLATLPAILASRAVVGAACAAILVSTTTLICDFRTGRERDRYLGLQTVAATVAATAFFAIGGQLGGLGWRASFALHLASLILLVPLMRRLPRRRKPAAPDVRRRPRRLSPVPWRQLLPRCALTIVGGVIFYTPVAQISFLLDNLGVTSAAMIGLVSTLVAISTVTGAVAYLQVLSTSPYSRMAVAMVLATVGFGCVAFIDDTSAVAGPQLELGLVIACIGCGLLLPTLLTWSVSPLRDAERGRGAGVWTGCYFLGQFTAPLAMLAVADRIGLLPAFACLACLCGGLAGLAMLAGRRPRATEGVTAM